MMKIPRKIRVNRPRLKKAGPSAGIGALKTAACRGTAGPVKSSFSRVTTKPLVALGSLVVVCTCQPVPSSSMRRSKSPGTGRPR